MTKKSLLSILICLVLIIALLPAAFADNNVTLSVAADNTITVSVPASVTPNKVTYWYKPGATGAAEIENVEKTDYTWTTNTETNLKTLDLTLDGIVAYINEKASSSITVAAGDQIIAKISLDGTSDTVEFHIYPPESAEQTALDSIGKVDVQTANANGKITGLKAGMEYKEKSSTGNWTAVTAVQETAGFAEVDPGTYEVRIKSKVGTDTASNTVYLSTLGTKKEVTVEPFVDYGISVGGTALTSVNKTIDFSAMPGSTNKTGKVSYNPDTKTLTLENAEIMGSDIVSNEATAIHITGTPADGEVITIKLAGNSKITPELQTGINSYYGIKSTKALSIEGDSLTITMPASGSMKGIECDKTLAIKNATEVKIPNSENSTAVGVSADSYAINSGKFLIVTIGDVGQATGITSLSKDSCITSKGNIAVTIGETTAQGLDSNGIVINKIVCEDGTISVNVNKANGLSSHSYALSPNNSAEKNKTIEVQNGMVALYGENASAYNFLKSNITTSRASYKVMAGQSAESLSEITEATTELKQYKYLLIFDGVPVESVTIGSDCAANIAVGGSSTYTATVLPTTATDKSVTWSVSNTDVASVDANGIVTVVSTATVGTKFNVRATSVSNPTKYGEKEITISSATEPTITLTKVSTDPVFTSLSGTKTLQVSVSPSTDYAKSKITWSIVSGGDVCLISKTGDNTVAAVSPVKVGTATVRATVYAGTTYAKNVDFTVTVKSTDYAITYPSANNSLIWYYDASSKPGFFVKTNIPKDQIKKVTVGELDATSSCTLTTDGSGTRVDVPYTWLHANIPSKTTKYYIKVYYGTGANDYVYKLLYSRSVKDAPVTGDQDMGIYEVLLGTSAVVGMSATGVYLNNKRKRKEQNL